LNPPPLASCIQVVRPEPNIAPAPTASRPVGDRDSLVQIDVGGFSLTARLETTRAPATCAALLRLLPLSGTLLQARWSGEAGWVPLGDLDLGIGPENPTSQPAPGQLLVYPKGVSETEILVPYGPTVFGSQFGTLAGNHCLTVVAGGEHLAEIGRRLVWRGAQPFRIGNPGETSS
jgi:hypothetical protein